MLSIMGRNAYLVPKPQHPAYFPLHLCDYYFKDYDQGDDRYDGGQPTTFFHDMFTWLVQLRFRLQVCMHDFISQLSHTVLYAQFYAVIHQFHSCYYYTIYNVVVIFHVNFITQIDP